MPARKSTKNTSTKSTPVKRVAKKATSKVVTPEPEPEVVEEATTVAEVEEATTVASEDTSTTTTTTNQPHLSKSEVRAVAAHQEFEDAMAEMSRLIAVAFESIRAANRIHKTLEKTHRRSIAPQKRKRMFRTGAPRRTPTVLFKPALLKYFKSRLTPEQMVVTRRSGNEETTVDLSNLDTNTCVHRTDVTQLFNKVFKVNNMLNEDDRRNINYSQDKDLVKLLTSGDINPKYNDLVKGIKNGTHRMTIFNIQCVTNQHLDKISRADRQKSASATTA